MKYFLMFLTTFLIQLIITTEMNIIAPMAPFLSQYFNIKDSSVIMFNIGFSLVGLLIPVLGILADRYGKRKSLIVALISYVLGTLVSGFAKKALLFAVGRVFIGIGYFSLSGTNLSYLSEFIPYESRGRASGILRIAFGLAILFSPLYATNMISKYKTPMGAYLPLTTIGIISLLLLFKLPETKKSKDIKLNLGQLIEIFKDPVSFKSLLIVFLILSAPTMFYGFLGIYMSNYFKLSQVEVGYIYSLIAIGTILGIIFATIFTDRIGKERLSKVLLTLLLLALIPIVFSKSMWIMVGALIIAAIGLDGGWTAYQTLCSEINPQKRGTFMSLFYTINAITITVFSILGPIFYNIGGYRLITIISLINISIGLKIFYGMSIEEEIS